VADVKSFAIEMRANYFKLSARPTQRMRNKPYNHQEQQKKNKQDKRKNGEKRERKM